MGKFCCVFDCGKHSERDKNISFHKIPAIISQQGYNSHDLSKIRRERWLASIRDAIQKGDVKQALSVPFTFIKLLFLGLSIFLKAFFYVREACGPLCCKSSRLGADQEHQSASVLKASKSTALEQHDHVLQ